MKINQKISSFVGIFFIILIVFFIEFWNYNQHYIQEIKDKRIAEYHTSLDSIISLMQESYLSIAFENTYWDEMVTFVSHQDDVWAEENLDMTTLNFEYTAVYNEKNDIVYYAQLHEKKDMLLNIFSKISLDLTNPTFYNYYIKHNGNLIQLFISPIQPSLDVQRLSKPRGYLLMGKRITREYLNKLEKQTSHKIKFITKDENEKFDFIHPFLSDSKDEIEHIGINVPSENIDVTSEIFKNQLIIITSSAILLILCLIFLIYNIIVKPLKRLTTIIEGNEKIDSIDKMLDREDEFGTIAKSIKNHFEQIHLLEEYKRTVDISSFVSKADWKGNITYVNDQFCNISGYTRDELIGKDHNIFRHEDMEKSIYKELWKTIKIDKKPWFGKIKNKAKDGTAYYVNTVINPILDSNGTLIEYIAIRDDITQHEVTKNDLKEQYSIASDKYEDVLYLSKSYEDAIEESNIILRLDLNRNISYGNDKFCEISGYSRSEIVGKSYSILNHPDVKSEDIKKIWEVLESGKTWKGDLKNLAKNGDTYYSIATIVPIKNKNGNIIEYIGIRKDITELVNLHNEIEETQRELIYKLGEIGETRSQETGNHVKRVAEYSKLLALKAGLSTEEAELLKYASPMHDIGKIGIADSILNKPGKLTTDEFEVMKTHATIGYEMLRGSNRPILQTSAIVAYYHHEKWDGSGYPRGLKENEIHLYGRITAIADVFDALASDRPYKKAWNLDKILNLLKEGKGTHFDPNLIELFLDNLDDFLEIKEKFN